MKKHLMMAVVTAAVMAGNSWVRAETQVVEDVKITHGVKGKVAIGEKAPAIEVKGVDGEDVTWESLAGKPVVLQFGSLTEPVFRMRAADVEKLAAKYGDKVIFVVVYQRESHPADGENPVEVNTEAGYAIARPVNQGERVNLAKQAVTRLALKQQRVVVDAWSNATSLRYGGYPNMTFVIDGEGKLQAGYAWMDTGAVKGALDAVMAGKPVPAEFRGRTEASVPAAMDYASAMKDMNGGRGSSLALLIDRMQLTDKQKTAIYPLIGSYLAEARNMREQFGGGGGPPGAAKKAPVAATTKPGEKAAGGEMMEGAAGVDKAKSAEDLKKAVEGVRTTAQKLKTAIKENLSEKDAKELLEVLAQGPAKRMFAD